MVIYLALFDSDENNEKIFDIIRYLIMLKSNFLINMRKSKWMSDVDLPLQNKIKYV